MKKLIPAWLLLSLIAIHIQGQTIKVVKSGATNNRLTIDYHLGKGKYQGEHIRLDENGEATFELKTDLPTICWIQGSPVLIYPQDKLTTVTFFPVKSERKRYNSISSISSAHAQQNRLIYDLYEIWHFKTAGITSFETLKTISEKKCKAEDLLSQLKPTDPFYALVVYANKMLSVQYNASVARSYNKPPKELFDCLRIVVPDDPLLDNFTTGIASNLLTAYYRLQAIQEGKSLDSPLKVNYEMLSRIHYERVLNSYASGVISTGLRVNGLNEEMSAMLKLIKSKVQDSAVLVKLAAKEAAFKKMSLDQPAIDFILRNAKGQQYTLADFRGKYVVFDLWATWCGSCIVALPEYLKLRQKFARDSGIVFLTVSIDDDRNLTIWEKFLKKNKMQGLELIAYGEEGKKFKRDYQITAVPRYMVIDTAGKLLMSHGSAYDRNFEKYISKLRPETTKPKTTDSLLTGLSADREYLRLLDMDTLTFNKEKLNYLQKIKSSSVLAKADFKRNLIRHIYLGIEKVEEILKKKYPGIALTYKEFASLKPQPADSIYLACYILDLRKSVLRADDDISFYKLFRIKDDIAVDAEEGYQKLYVLANQGQNRISGKN